MSTGGKQDNQASMDSDKGGGNLTGKAPSAKLYQPPDFMGKSGQPDNQSTDRGKGRT
jgi:hypothetical protein